MFFYGGKWQKIKIVNLCFFLNLEKLKDEC